MTSLRTRVARLELADGDAFAIVPWELDSAARASTLVAGVRYTQEHGETRQGFFDRVGQVVPARVVLWADHVDVRL